MTTESREQDPGSARASRKSRGSPAIIEAGGSGALDTSGDIFIPDVRFPSASTRIRWPDLDAFTQGYIEALFATPIMVPGPDGPEPLLHPAFSDLTPEALARIIADCRLYSRLYQFVPHNEEWGRMLWEYRNSKCGHPDFPPLTVTLGDDGKVRLSSQRTADAGGEAVHSSPATDEQP